MLVMGKTQVCTADGKLYKDFTGARVKSNLALSYVIRAS